VSVVETERLALHWLRLADAVFIRELVTEPSWLEFIGDKGVRTLADARRYAAHGPQDQPALQARAWGVTGSARPCRWHPPP
jgi:hypothetical protein